MSKFHDVVPGDHMPRIAAKYGFGDIADIWKDPKNADLAKRRKPCVLAPGDVVFIPDKLAKTISLSTTREHVFVVKQLHIVLRLTLGDASGTPLAGVDCKLDCGDAVFSLTTDSRGKLEQEIPVDTKSCKLTFLDREIQLDVGHLDPPDQPSGWRTRLNNLGYHAGPEPPEDDDSETEEAKLTLRSAIEEFQCDNGIKPNGICDRPTQEKLVVVHGA